MTSLYIRDQPSKYLLELATLKKSAIALLKNCAHLPVDPILDCLVGPVTLVKNGVELLVCRDEEDGGIALEKSLFSVARIVEYF
jgi:hypothetical protein